MKTRFLILLIFMLFSQFQLIGQNTNQNENFEIMKIGEHGFVKLKNKFYYRLDIEIKNNTSFKLKKTKLCASINQLRTFGSCSSQIYNSIWHPQSVIKFEMVISKKDNWHIINEDSFDRTPENILLTLKINAHNIDIDFDELISKYNIKDDWKYFQKVLGLRDIETGEKLKIIRLTDAESLILILNWFDKETENLETFGTVTENNLEELIEFANYNSVLPEERYEELFKTKPDLSDADGVKNYLARYLWVENIDSVRKSIVESGSYTKEEYLKLFEDKVNELPTIQDYRYGKEVVEVKVPVVRNGLIDRVSGRGSDYQLGNRKTLNRPKPDYNCEEEGLVIVTIKVDRAGKVIKADAGARGSTNTARCLLTSAKEAALKTTWQSDSNARRKQIGIIKYRFSIN